MKILVSWFGFSKSQYEEQVKQSGDPEWAELGPDEDGDGCKYEEAAE